MLSIFLLADRFAHPGLGRPENEVGKPTFMQRLRRGRIFLFEMK
jgi:hypothetical protein